MFCTALTSNAQIDNSLGDPVLNLFAVGAKFQVFETDAKIETPNGSCTFQEVMDGTANEGVLNNTSTFSLSFSNGINVQLELFRGSDTFEVLNRATQWQMHMLGDMYANMPEGQRNVDYGFNLNVDSTGTFTDSRMRLSGLVPNNGNAKYVALNVCYLRYCDAYVLVVVNGPVELASQINNYVVDGSFSRHPNQFTETPLTVEEMAERSDGIHYAAVFFGNLFGFTYGDKLAEHRREVIATPYAYYRELFGKEAHSYKKEYGNVPKEMQDQIKEQVKLVKSRLAEIGVKKLTP